MPARKNKDDYGFTYVILGLILGFFLGSGIVYWYSNRHNDSLLANSAWNYLARIFQGNVKTGTYSVPEEDLEDLNFEPARTRPQTDRLTDISTAQNDTLSLLADSLGMDPNLLAADSLLLFDQLSGNSDNSITSNEIGMTTADSIQASVSPQVGMRIAQDRLLLIRAYNLPATLRNAPQKQSFRQLDSLLGNYQRRSDTENMLVVEFWQSPLNFRGYKMSHHKLIIYGLDQVEAFSLHSDGKSFFIKYFENIYPVSQTLEFKQLIPLLDPVLLEEFQPRWY